MRLRPLLLLLSTSAALLLPSASVGAQDGNGPAPGIATQLPRGVIPSHYAIRVTPNAAALTFKASATIDIKVSAPTQTIILNANELTIEAATITPLGKDASVVATPKIDAAAQTLTLSFGQIIAPGSYRLAFQYTGVINTQANGLFALDYKDGSGQQKRALFTQFEAPDARRFVPSFDEPSYKATFDLSVAVPKGQMAVSNMPVARTEPQADGSSLVTFATSPKMSTYLLFLGLGELDRKTLMSGKTEVGVVTGRGNTGKAQLALDASAAILPEFNDYFGVPYPLPKLDNVAGPGQSQFFSAMENWGAIFTFERAMLVDPKSTSEATRRRVFEIVAHEMAHQWFGNLVTMAWWDDLWLNEGFASWMATRVTDRLHPEWEALLGRVDGRESAMGLDAYSTTHPVVQHVRTVDEVNQAFDAITYEKGEAVITMLESFAGADVWRAGIRDYMKRHAYGNTTTQDLWNAVERAGAKGLSVIADDFTRKPGIPMMKVESAVCTGNVTRIALSQGEFRRDADGAQTRTPLRWHVPVSANVIGQQRVTTVINGAGTIELPGCGAYVINSGQAGYYRSLYPEENVKALADSFTALPAIDQLGLLADNWQLGQGSYQPIGLSLDLLDAVPANASDSVLADLPDYVEAMRNIVLSDPKGGKLATRYAFTKLKPILERVGFDAKAGEGPQVPLLRQNVISTLGDMGEPSVLAEARKRFAALKDNSAALDGPLKFVWLGIVARTADAPTWAALRKMAQAAPSALERQQFYTLLGKASDPDLAKRALDLAMTDEPGKTTGAAIIAAVASSHSMQAVDYVLARKAKYDAMIDVSARSQAVARLGNESANPAMADKLAQFANKYLTADNRKVVDRTIAAIRARAASRAKLKPEVLRWLSARGVPSKSSMR